MTGHPEPTTYPFSEHDRLVVDPTYERLRAAESALEEIPWREGSILRGPSALSVAW